MSKSFCTPNFDEISQYTAELSLLPVCESVRSHIGILLTSGFDFDRFIVVGMACCIAVPNLIKISQRRRSYDVISIFKMAAIESEIYSRLRF